MAMASAGHNSTWHHIEPLSLICDATSETLDAWTRQYILAFTGMALLALVAGHVVHIAHLNFLPEALVSVAFGALLGTILYFSTWGGESRGIDSDLEEVVFGFVLKYFCLPVIIFESGWSLRLRDFVSQFGYILLVAVLGTTVSILVVAQLIIATSDYHIIQDQKTAYAIACLISSTDPVATLSTFGSLNVDPLLFIMVFGESQINDAVAITIFQSLNSMKSRDSIWQMVLEVPVLLFGSAGLGLCLAVVFILIFRISRIGHSASQAILFIIVSCYFTYALAEEVGMSGIITVLFNSILMGVYAPAHLSVESTTLASFLLKQLSSLADMTIFMLCGVSVVFVTWEGLVLGSWLCLLCLVGRAAAIFPCCMVSNVIKHFVGKRLPAERKNNISWKHQFMMWHSGLRGGISLLLAKELGTWVDPANGRDVKGQIVDATFLLVCAYLLVFGGTTGMFLRLVGLPLGDQVPEGVSLYDAADKPGFAWRGLDFFRARLLKPLLIGNRVDFDSGVIHNVLSGVIHDARQAESAPDFGDLSHLARRHTSVMVIQDRASTLALFGTNDPAHVDQFEDAFRANGPAIDRCNSGLSSLSESEESDLPLESDA
ncbi:unnamed protein product [Polarella glacialis]|uniref:Cation/H+ exchanger transmembrane domain-containing protein n=1 Tax=Polarella glacialis TaxID=89957 RepID=A0A813HI13_POLGL|nr:unnamed protein product [Polarella glacialis]